MPTWQFWTLIGVISAFGIYIVSSLSALIDAMSKTNQFLAMIYNKLIGQ